MNKSALKLICKQNSGQLSRVTRRQSLALAVAGRSTAAASRSTAAACRSPTACSSSPGGSRAERTSTKWRCRAYKARRPLISTAWLTCRQRHITLVNFLKWARRGRAEAASRRAKLLHLSSQQGRGPGLIIPGDPRSRAEPGGEGGEGEDVHRNTRHGQALLQEQVWLRSTRLKWRCRACKSKAAFDQHCWLICRQRLCSPFDDMSGQSVHWRPIKGLQEMVS